MTGPVGMTGQVERFFAGYCDAFNRSDAPAIARYFAVPCLLVEEATTVWSTGRDVLQAITRLLSFYAAQGFETLDFKVERVLALDDGHVVADIAWTIGRTGGRPTWRFRTAYNLRYAAGDWRIVCCTAYQEARVRQHMG